MLILVEENKMNLYLLKQDVNTGYNTYDSVVVAAESEDIARLIPPIDIERYDDEDPYYYWDCDWARPEDVRVILIGTAHSGIEQGVILASFNAG
jgi:hypothetical protein